MSEYISYSIFEKRTIPHSISEESIESQQEYEQINTYAHENDILKKKLDIAEKKLSKVIEDLEDSIAYNNILSQHLKEKTKEIHDMRDFTENLYSVYHKVKKENNEIKKELMQI